MPVSAVIPGTCFSRLPGAQAGKSPLMALTRFARGGLKLEQLLPVLSIAAEEALTSGVCFALSVSSSAMPPSEALTMRAFFEEVSRIVEMDGGQHAALLKLAEAVDASAATHTVEPRDLLAGGAGHCDHVAGDTSAVEVVKAVLNDVALDGTPNVFAERVCAAANARLSGQVVKVVSTPTTWKETPVWASQEKKDAHAMQFAFSVTGGDYATPLAQLFGIDKAYVGHRSSRPGGHEVVTGEEPSEGERELYFTLWVVLE